MKKTLFSAMCALFLCSGMSAKVIYVTTDGNDNNAGTSLETAVKDLNVAISKADKGDDIYIAAGTYVFNTSIMMKNGVSFYGGFAKGETSVDVRQRPNPQTEPWNFTNETIFTGENENRLMEREDKSSLWDMLYVDGITFNNYKVTKDWRFLYFRNSVTFQNNKVINCAANATLVYGEENFIVRDCYFANNSNLGDLTKTNSVIYFCGYAVGSLPNRMENCVFEANKMQSFGLYNYNGGPQNQSDEVLITKCLFKDNTDKCIGIAYDWSEGTMAITDCLFEGNATTVSGTVLSGKSNVQASFANNIIRNNQNTAESGDEWRSALITTVSNMVLANNLIVNNTSKQLLIDIQGGTQLNNTIANNKGTLYIDGAGSPFWYNNIIVNNEASREKTVEVAANNELCWIEYSAFDTEIDFGEATNSNNVIDVTPFVNPASFKGIALDATQKEESAKADYSLKEASLAINSGTTEFDYNCELEDAWVEKFMKKDIAGNDRIVNGKINMGAYQGSALTGIYPNNTDNGSSVVAYGNQLVITSDENSVVEVYSIVGEMVLTMPVAAGDNTVNMSGNGFYLVKVSNVNGSKTFKVLVK